MSEKRRFVVAGTGTRGTSSWVRPMLGNFSEEVEPVGLFDINPGRAHACNKIIGGNIPVYEDFDEMLAQATPDALMVATTDATHAEYVVKGAEAGLSVYCEKPLCTTIDQVKAIRSAAAACDKPMMVTHNMRCLPGAETMRREITNGRVGEVKHIVFGETLDRFHGADYYRRWHRKAKNSGGLLLQKSSHHFDFINWLVASRPSSVSAHGSLTFYGKNGPYRGNRCSDCEHTKECFFYADVFGTGELDVLFRDVENVDGYHRDQCVFGEEIDIDDTMNAIISYENGVLLSYSLIAYASYEGMHIAVEGTEGRLEWIVKHGTSWAVGSRKSDKNKDGLAQSGKDSTELVYYDPENRKLDLTPPVAKGGHGGADPIVMHFVFDREQPDDPLGQRASLEDGVQAVLIGIAANESIQLKGQSVAVQTD